MQVDTIVLFAAYYGCYEIPPVSDRRMTYAEASDPNLTLTQPNSNPNPRSRHNVLVGPMRWFAVALTQRSDGSEWSDAVFHRASWRICIFNRQRLFRPPVYGSNGRTYKMLVMFFFLFYFATRSPRSLGRSPWNLATWSETGWIE